MPSVHRKTKSTYNISGHAHELTFSCHLQLPLLTKDRTRHWFVESLDKARIRWQFDLWAWVIMPEHVHLLLKPKDTEYEISNILKGIKQSVSRKAISFLKDHNSNLLNRLIVTRPNGKKEHRFWMQGGGYDRNIISPEVAIKSIEYIHANPVRRGLAETPIQWKWSSAQWYSGVGESLLSIDPVEF